MYEHLDLRQDGDVVWATMNRPERLNALNRRLVEELRDFFVGLYWRRDVRVVVLSGAGRAFCAGMDMDELQVLPPDDISRQEWMRPYDMNRRADYQTRYSYFPGISKPIIAAINGAAAGLGLVFALYSDFRLASTSAVFATAFAKRGLIAEHGIAWMLPKIVGHANAIDLLLTSRKVSAQDALSMQLVHRLVEPESLLDEARSLATALSQDVSPRSLRVMKRQLWEAPFQSLSESVALANAEMYHSILSEDFQEGVAHFQERRPARFTGK